MTNEYIYSPADEKRRARRAKAFEIVHGIISVVALITLFVLAGGR